MFNSKKKLMMTKRQKIKRKILGFLSLSTALFVFQACYGPPQDMNDDVYIQGVVKSKKTNAPIPGIKVSVEDNQSVVTDENGFFELYAIVNGSYNLICTDIDDQDNGQYSEKDTLLDNTESEYYVEVLMDEI